MKPCEFGCGTPVTFVLLGYDEERKRMWSPPMESTVREVKQKRAKGFEYGDLVVTERFAVHTCTAGTEIREARRLLEQQKHAQRVDTARRREEAWVEALKGVCPKCGAFAGALCFNLSKTGATTKWPHAERLPPGWPDV